MRAARARGRIKRHRARTNEGMQMEVNSQRNGEQWRNGGSYRFVMCRTRRGWSVWTLGVAKIWRIRAFKQRVGNFQKALQGLRMLCAAHCSAAWPGQLLFPYLWLCSAALPLWGHGGAAGKHEWKNKGGFFSFQMVRSCSVIMQAMCGIWASLGVGYKELKGLGQFLFSFPKWIQMQMNALLLGYTGHHDEANWR